MENQTSSQSSGGFFRSAFTPLVIFLSIAIGFIVYLFVLGDPSHFEGNDPKNHPKPGDFYGIVYKGGYIVPFLIAIVLIIVTVTIERLFTILRARGKGNL